MALAAQLCNGLDQSCMRCRCGGDNATSPKIQPPALAKVQGGTWTMTVL